MEGSPGSTSDALDDKNRALKRRRPDSHSADHVGLKPESSAADNFLSTGAGSTEPLIKSDMVGMAGQGPVADFASLQREAESVLTSRNYQPYLFNPTTPTGYCFGGMRLEMFRTDTIGGSIGDIYFVCVESFFDTPGPLGLKLTLSTQGWLLANSGNMTEKNEHLGPGIDYFIDDMLLSINGSNLVGLELSEVVKIIGSSAAPRKLLTCRFFKSIPGALAWMVKIWAARKNTVSKITLSANYDTNGTLTDAI